MNRIFLIVIILIFSSLSFFISYTVSKKDTAGAKGDKLPLPEEFITSPALQAFSANIQGVVVNKGSDYFVLEENARTVKLFLELNGITTFVPESNINTVLKFEDIKIGDRLKGGTSIVVSRESAVGMSAKRNRGDIIAHYFIVEKR